VSAVFGPGPNGEPNDPRSEHRYALYRDLATEQILSGNLEGMAKSRGLLVFIMLNPIEREQPLGRRRSEGKQVSDEQVREAPALPKVEHSGCDQQRSDRSSLHLARAVGENNDGTLLALAGGADRVVCAWGTNGKMKGRESAVLDLLKGRELWALRLTSQGHPQHPLYMPSDTKPFVWERSK